MYACEGSSLPGALAGANGFAGHVRGRGAQVLQGGAIIQRFRTLAQRRNA